MKDDKLAEILKRMEKEANAETIASLIVLVLCVIFLIWKYNAVMALDMPETVKWLLLLR